MGKTFGELAKMSGIVTYRLSPHELKLFPDNFLDMVLNLKRRFTSAVTRVAPSGILVYLIYDWGKKENDKACRKNPKDFENDV